MALSIPKLRTGVTYQHPIIRDAGGPSSTLRFIDGKEQRFEKGRSKRRWILTFSQLSEDEMAALEVFVRSASLLEEPIEMVDPFDGVKHAECYLDADTVTLEYDGSGLGVASLVIRAE